MKQFFEAIRAGDGAAVESMLDADPRLLQAVDDSGLPALTVCFYHHKADIAQCLEQRGAKVDLFNAAMSGRTERVREFIAQTPDAVNSFSSDGWTPLHLAAFFGSSECVQVLLDAGAKPNERSTNAMRNMPLHAAAAGRHAAIERVLLERGSWVNARQNGGFTALHAAALNGDLEMAELLIAAGADVKARADNNQNALDLALTKGHQQMVELLDHYGASS